MTRFWHTAVTTLIMVCQSTQALALGGIALLLPLIRQDLGLTFAQAGMLSAASGLVYAAMQIPSGYLADRWGPKALFITGAIGANLMTLTFALIESYPLLLLNQGVSGFFRALIFTPGMLLMQAQFAEGRRATASGLAIAGGLIFNVALNLTGPLLVVSLGWRGLLMICAVGILLAACGFAAMGPGPRPSGRTPLSPAELPALIKLPLLQWAGAVNFVRHAVVNGWNFWLPTYLTAEKELTLVMAGVLVAISTALTVPSNFLGGYLSDQLGRPIGVIIASFIMLGVGLVLLAQADSLPFIVLAVSIVGMFIQFSFGAAFAYPVKIIGSRSAGFVSGFSNTCANLGGLSAAYALGVVKDTTGAFAPGLYALTLTCTFGVLAALMLGRSGKSQAARRS
jgi:ACS family D-galactonate transporter-like MFS transporter